MNFSMEGFKVKKRSQVIFTQELAQEVLSLERFEGDRDAKEHWVNYLAQQMKEGTFLWELVTIIACVYKKKTYRLNCQHVSCAIREHMPKNFKSSTKVNYIVVEANSDYDLRKLYSIIDNNKPRTFYDKLIARLYGTKELKQISKSEIKRIGSGYANYLSGGMKATFELDIICDNMINENQTECMRIHDLMVSKPYDKSTAFLWKTQPIAIMFMTLEHHSKMFEDFWSGVLNHDTLKMDDPRKTLAKLLNQDIGIQRKLVAPERPRVFVFKSCMYAFIKWANGEKIRSISQFSSVNKIGDIEGLFIKPKGK